jgi:FMN reductase/FAD reductase [NAD(P)H]
VIENQLKPIAVFFRAYTVPGYVYLNNEHFGIDKKIEDEGVLQRLEKLAEEIVFMLKKQLKNPDIARGAF